MRMSIEIEQHLKKLPGGRAIIPHVVRLQLNRTKLDGNRDLPEACDADNHLAREAWALYHGAIHKSIQLCLKKFGHCHVFDLQYVEHMRSGHITANLGSV